MNKQKINNKLSELKNLISGMHCETIGLIEISAELEIKLRKNGLSNIELAVIDDELDRLLEKYSQKKYSE
jgi:hypothetical protein